MALTGFTDFSPGYIETFETGVILQAQQTESKLLKHLNVEQQAAKTDHYRTFSSVGVTLNAAKGAATSYDGGVVDTRALTLNRITVADTISREDLIKFGADPAPTIIQAFAGAIGRQIDTYILAALTGNATAGSGTIALPGGNELAVDHGTTGTSSALTMGKLKALKLAFDVANIPEEDRYAVVHPGALLSLLSDNTVTSSDFNTVKPLVYGELDVLLGFRFIRSNLVTRASGNDKNVFFSKKGIAAAFGQGDGTGVKTFIRDLPGYTTDKEVLNEVYFGATRLQEPMVHTVLTDSTKY